MALRVLAVRRNSQNANSPSPLARTHALGFQSPPKNPRPAAGGFVNIRAHAKINLYLDVLDKRPDGYHSIVSIMQSLGLCDELTIRAGAVSSESAAVSLICDDLTLPTDESNLVVKAAMLLMREYGIGQDIKVELTKRIPAGAGLAGGSSDCAATLFGINELFQLNIPMDKLMEHGRTLGADVPFNLVSGAGIFTALSEGIGEKLTPLPAHPDCHIVVVCPKIHVSTADAYARLDAVKMGAAGQANDELVPKDILCDSAPRTLQAEGQGLANLMMALSAGDVAQISANFFNIFTFVTADIHPEIFRIIRELKGLGALGASMSGTGSAVFAYFADENKAKAACDKFPEHKVFLTYPKRG
ncbi:MAG: 4-(cytidine 5'-diphospho)-2-C-methyl-D-erythritol kinase [Defluviitaleaceae bacterium]|nr:4-(cytidine 5'-diphospho)-2-C-methyl-D-erythritol kinase [Defluviitaleaceae bacterium]